jgi:superfamily II DNA or RNA helicase
VITFEMDNDRTWIHGADPSMLYVFDVETSFCVQADFQMQTAAAAPSPLGGGWDGWVHLLRQPRTQPPWVPSGLLPRLVRACRKLRFPYELRDLRQRPEEQLPEFCGKTIVDRDYQLEAVDRAIKAGRGVLDMPPRSGKTRVGCEIQRRLALPTIWLAPTDRIVQQTRDVLEGFFGQHYVVHQVGTRGEKEAARARVVVCTAATANNLSPDFYATRQIIIVDEFHHAAARTYRQIFDRCKHVYYRFGLTGTFFRSGEDGLAMHALLSNTVHKVSSKELCVRGFLVPTKVCFLPVEAPRLRGLPTTAFQGGHGTYGIEQHEVRNKMIRRVVRSLHKSGRKTLVLVGTKAHGRLLCRDLRRFIHDAPQGCEFESVEFVSTDVDRSRQARILDSFLADQEVRVLIGTSLLGEGVDLPAADALVYARGGSAEVTLVQNAYRVGTAMPGKMSALIVDFADRHHRKLLEHSQERLATYFREATFQVEVLKTLDDFGGWMKAQGGVSIE